MAAILKDIICELPEKRKSENADKNINNIKKLYITDSGGPIFGRKMKELLNVTPKEALNHPTWSMGRKISIDSATMMNKAIEIIEASITSGCTERQLLWKVKMPLAFPEIILGANQTLMFALFMVMIAGFIGTVDLSQEIFRALSFNDGGKGLIIGLCVAFIGLTADRLLVEWSNQMKQKLGFQT